MKFPPPRALRLTLTAVAASALFAACSKSEDDALLRTQVSRARHDLRNPLSDILGFGQILQEEALAAGHRHLVPDFQTVHEAAAHYTASGLPDPALLIREDRER